MSDPSGFAALLALDRLLEGCQVIDRDFRYRYVNPAAAAHGRTTVDQLVGRTMMEAYPGIEASETFRIIRGVMESGQARRLDNEFFFPDGSRGWFQLSIEPVREGVFILSVDLTERINAERALRESDQRHRALLAGIPDSVLLLDDEGRLIDLHAPDPPWLAVAGAQAAGRRVEELLGGDAGEHLARMVHEVGASGRHLGLPLAFTVGGSLRQHEATTVPAGDGRVTIVLRDVTARQNLEAQLRQAQKMEAIGQLTGGIAHDFNNVLTVIGSNAELLVGSPSEAEVREGTAEILKATQRGADMIAQLLRFSRRGMLERRLLDPAEVVREFSTMLRHLVPASVRLEFGASDSGHLVQLDPGALEQVVANLATNARDAMPDGGELRIDCTATYLDEGYHATHPWVRPGQYICISVSDTGIGMNEETRQRIFEPFFTTKPAGVGTGLGMAMVYGLVKEHGGMVHVYSEPGRGTEVKLYFPISDAEGPSGQRRARSDPRALPGGKELLLLVEDDAAIRRASRRALEGRGYTILEANDGEQALELFHRNRLRIALVISDLVMPNLGGRQLAEALRAEGETVPILFTSGYSESAVYREAALPEGVTFLHKPWTLSDLFTRVRGILDGAGDGKG